jgi:hypothetical protein
MTDPTDRAITAIGELTNVVRSLDSDVKDSEALRTRKIRAIQNLLYAVIPAIILLIILAFTNFVLLARVKDTAIDAKNTNDLLVSCFQPGTPCSNNSNQRTGEALNQLRQTQFVIAICQRQNPVTDDPNGNKMVACVQRYYPNFKLPPKVK